MKMTVFLIICFLSIQFVSAENLMKRKNEDEGAGKFYSAEQAKEITEKEKYLKEKQEQADFLRNKESIQYFKIRQQWKRKGQIDSKLEDKIFDEERSSKAKRLELVKDATGSNILKEKNLEADKAFEKAMSSELLISNQQEAREFLVKELGLDIELIDMLEIYETKDLLVFKPLSIAYIGTDDEYYQVSKIDEKRTLEEWEYVQQTQSYRKEQIVVDNSERKFIRDSSVIFFLADEKEFNIVDKE